MNNINTILVEEWRNMESIGFPNYSVSNTGNIRNSIIRGGYYWKRIE